MAINYRQKLIVQTPDHEQHVHETPPGYGGVGWSNDGPSLLIHGMVEAPGGGWLHDLVVAEYTSWSKVERVISVPAGEEN